MCVIGDEADEETPRYNRQPNAGCPGALSAAPQRALLTATIGGDRVAGRAAVTSYLNQLVAADAQRNANPLPDRPAC